jgi:hypothetical protein
MKRRSPVQLSLEVLERHMHGAVRDGGLVFQPQSRLRLKRDLLGEPQQCRDGIEQPPDGGRRESAQAVLHQRSCVVVSGGEVKPPGQVLKTLELSHEPRGALNGPPRRRITAR